jgi:hypothetical protein
VCETESPFVQVTVVPTATVRSPGENALFPSDSAPTGIVTDDDVPAGGNDGVGADGDGVGLGDDE